MAPLRRHFHERYTVAAQPACPGVCAGETESQARLSAPKKGSDPFLCALFVSCGARPTTGPSWKEIFAAEVRPHMPDSSWSRVHFLGHLPYQYFILLLQLSTVHVYLTYPFVLSWSLLEAMSIGCAIVASDTQPLHEAITHNETGRLVSFFDVAGLANEVCTLLDDPATRQRLGQHARAFAQANYDLKRVCLPRQLAWVEGLAP